jgi:hypothetical protein
VLGNVLASNRLSTFLPSLFVNELLFIRLNLLWTEVKRGGQNLSGAMVYVYVMVVFILIHL